MYFKCLAGKHINLSIDIKCAGVVTRCIQTKRTVTVGLGVQEFFDFPSQTKEVLMQLTPKLAMKR